MTTTTQLTLMGEPIIKGRFAAAKQLLCRAETVCLAPVLMDAAHKVSHVFAPDEKNMAIAALFTLSFGLLGSVKALRAAEKKIWRKTLGPMVLDEKIIKAKEAKEICLPSFAETKAIWGVTLLNGAVLCGCAGAAFFFSSPLLVLALPVAARAAAGSRVGLRLGCGYWVLAEAPKEQGPGFLSFKKKEERDLLGKPCSVPVRVTSPKSYER